MTIAQRWRQVSLPNKAIVFTSVMVAAGTLFYAVMAACQVAIMNTSARESASQVDKVVDATNTSIEKAVKASASAIDTAIQKNKEALDEALTQNRNELRESIRQSKAALDTSIQASRLDQRAWVGVDKSYITRMSDPFVSYVDLRNTGKTPAYNLRRASAYMISGHVVDGPAPAFITTLEKTFKEKTAKRSLIPGGTTILESDDADSYVAKEWKAISEGQKFLYIYGRLEYDDVFLAHHTTTFCFYLRNPAEKQYAICEAYNEMN